MNYIKRIRRAFSSLEHTADIINMIETRNRYKQLYLTTNNIGVSDESIADVPVIVTLTTYGNKIHGAYLAIESMLHQTLKPNKIILWLDNEKYKDNDSIPLTLRKQESRGLTIELCKDVRSHTKMVPALNQYPDAILISIDDDMIYPIDFIERLVKAYRKDPTKIYFYRGHYMVFDKNNECEPYIEWVKKGASGCSIYNVPTGVGGILYPPHCMNKDVVNSEIFLKLCPFADDIWFKMMSYLNDVECELIPTINYNEQFIPLEIETESSLQNYNVANGGNDHQIKNLITRYNIKKK